MDNHNNTLTIKDRFNARFVILALKLISRIIDRYGNQYLSFTHHIADRLSVNEINVHAMYASRLLSELYEKKSDSQSDDADKRNLMDLSYAFHDIDAWIE